MTPETPDETTIALGVEEGVVLALQAEDTGDWKPVVDWLAQHPEYAAALADFLAGERRFVALTRPSHQATSRSGSTLAEFQLHDEIGHGGMGVVYRAVDNLHRDVAVKLLRSGEAYSATEAARFRIEAELVASLDHPNIVKILAFGEWDQQPYLVMPLLTGGSLAASLKQRADRALPAHEAAELVRQIALGVHHAHQRGLLHRDLKPGNILLDHEGTPHVADFGLARKLDVMDSRSGQIAGTLLYMAPEQARGEKGLTTAVDIHALGVILFELLTGRTPFVGGDMASVIRCVLEESAPLVRTLRPEMDRDLEAICQKCLQKEPSDRYASAAELADDLAKFLRGEPISAPPTGWLRATLRRALGRQREMAGVVSWRGVFYGSASCIMAMLVWQIALLLDAPLWMSQASVIAYLFGYMTIIWYLIVKNKDALSPIERASTGIHYGIKFGCVAILIVEWWLHQGDPIYALPAFLVLIGLGVYAHGFIYWGRYYLVGASFYVVAALMPLVPVLYWPSVYGVYLGLFQIAVGLHLRSVHRAATADPARTAP